jgi:gliding motility-associated-like protein
MTPKPEQPACLARKGKTIFLVAFLFLSIAAAAQICDCPKPATCAPCRGGLTKLTLRLNTLMTLKVVASDGPGAANELYNGNVGGGNTFTLVSSRPNDKFQGPEITITVGNFSPVKIKTGCTSDAEIGKRFGFVEIVAAESKDGGTICCKESDYDDDAPEIRGCVNRSVNLSAANVGDCKATVRWTEPTYTDECTVVSFTSNYHSGDAFPVGNTTVTYTAIDKVGNKEECSFTVTVVDNLNPVINGPGSFNVPATGPCETAVTWTPPSVSDCSAVTLTSTHNPGSLFPNGETTKVTYTARDARGRTSTHSFDVHVGDGAPATFMNCPADINVQENSGCEAAVTWTPPTVSNNCGTPFVIKANHQPGSKFRVGTSTRVEYTATDPRGNKVTCSFMVNVTTAATPVVTDCPSGPIRVQANELGEAVAHWPEPRATVACGDVPVERSHAPGSIFNIGTTNVVYTFGQGDHTATCSFDVVVAPPDIAIEIGKALTPNGDGIHDYWELVTIEKYKDNAVLVIDRWGNKIYEANSYDNERIAWDGHNQQGVKVPTGTYFYTVEVRVQGIVWKRKGSLEVIQP